MVTINWQSASRSSSASASSPSIAFAHAAPQDTAPSADAGELWFAVAMGLFGIIIGYAVSVSGLL